MAQNKKTEQTPIAPDASWEEMVASSKELPDILPKLKFGEGKTDEVAVDVVFLEDQPRVIEYDDPFSGGKGKSFVVNVRVISGPENGSSRSLMMPKSLEHGLTRGITNLAKKGGTNLKGRAARIETRNYKHKQYGPTRGYTVSEISPPSEQPF